MPLLIMLSNNYEFVDARVLTNSIVEWYISLIMLEDPLGDFTQITFFFSLLRLDGPGEPLLCPLHQAQQRQMPHEVRHAGGVGAAALYRHAGDNTHAQARLSGAQEVLRLCGPLQVIHSKKWILK